MCVSGRFWSCVCRNCEGVMIIESALFYKLGSYVDMSGGCLDLIVSNCCMIGGIRHFF